MRSGSGRAIRKNNFKTMVGSSRDRDLSFIQIPRTKRISGWEGKVPYHDNLAYVPEFTRH